MEILKLGSRGDSVKTLQRILNVPDDGIFGKETEESVLKFQRDNNLIVDGIIGPKTWESLIKRTFTIQNEITSAPIEVHITEAVDRNIEYLVIHFTAGSTSLDKGVLKNREVFLSREASADFIVGDTLILQVNPDLRNYYCWAVGDGKGKYGVTNKNSISIEICSNLRKGTTAKVPNHEGWYFTKESLDNTIKLAKYLMSVYNIPIEKVIRHYDASKKLCPGILGWNLGSIYNSTTGEKTSQYNNELEWLNFKAQLI